MSRLLGTPLPLAPWVLRCGSRVTKRWRRDGFEGLAPGMPGHSVATYSAHRAEFLSVDDLENDPLAVPGSGFRHGHRDPRQPRRALVTRGGQLDVSHVYLTSERLQACADQVGNGGRVELLRRVGFEDASGARILKLLAHEAEVDDASSTLFVEQAMDLLCLQLLRRHAAFAVDAPSRVRGALAGWQTKRVTHFMLDHLDRELRLPELAAVVGLSRFHFCSAFRAATGKVAARCLADRSAHAARARAARGPTVDDHRGSALAVGFQTPSAFAASFRRVVGTSPSEYRRRL